MGKIILEDNFVVFFKGLIDILDSITHILDYIFFQKITVVLPTGVFRKASNHAKQNFEVSKSIAG